MALRQEAVLVNAGSYTINPKSSSDTLIWRKSIALTMPSDVGIWYVRPVRLSVMVSVLSLMAQISPPIAWRYIRARPNRIMLLPPGRGQGQLARGTSAECPVADLAGKAR